MSTNSQARGPVEAAFAAQLQWAMNAKRLAPPDLAARAGISGSAVRNYLKGNFLPRPAVLAALERVLGVEFVMTAGTTKPIREIVEEILDGGDTGATAAPAAEPGLTIPEAKRRLARTLGVDETQIEISVRA